MLTGEDEYVVSSVFTRYHSFTNIASHLFPLFFRYGTVNFNSKIKWICASFTTNHFCINRCFKTLEKVLESP